MVWQLAQSYVEVADLGLEACTEHRGFELCLCPSLAVGEMDRYSGCRVVECSVNAVHMTGPGRVPANPDANLRVNKNGIGNVAGMAGRVCWSARAARRGRERRDDIDFGPW